MFYVTTVYKDMLQVFMLYRNYYWRKMYMIAVEWASKLQYGNTASLRVHQLSSEQVHIQANVVGTGIGNFQTFLGLLDRKPQHCEMEKAIINMKKGKWKEHLWKDTYFFLDNVSFITIMVTLSLLILHPPKSVELL